MRDLTILEQLILAAIISLDDEAYSVTIRKRVKKMAKKNIMYGTLYNALSQLQQKGYVTKTKGQSSPERRGRPKMFYKTTAKGIEALLKAHDIQMGIWASLQDLLHSHRK
jgi:DNA-binding PadR family transcriptional regulator